MRKPGALRRVEREAAVLKWLINHPLSTADQVWKATGFGVMTNTRFLAQEKQGAKTLWSVNRLKWVHWLRNLPGVQLEVRSGE